MALLPKYPIIRFGTPTDGEIVEPYDPAAFNVAIISNASENGKGIITFDGDVTTIRSSAFENCSGLTRVSIPNGVTTIEAYAFGDCSKQQEFNGKFASKDGRCLIIDGVLNSFAPAGLTGYTIPDSVTSIGDYAFRYSINSLNSLNSLLKETHINPS